MSGQGQLGTCWWRFDRLACVLILVAAGTVDVGVAEIVDRMVAIVDGRVVTLGDLNRYRNMSVLFEDSVPDDQAELLEELIENLLIQDEIDQFGLIRVEPALIDEFISQLGDIPNSELVQVQEAVRDRLERINFFDTRFRRFTLATDQEISTYYETVFRPAARVGSLESIPELDEIRDLVRENVVTEKTNGQIETWIDSLVRRSDVEIVMYVE